ncbi:MAG: ribonuclease HI [Clostridiales Family XIII bacterium]|jgi:ribonuclease HI|nr:ribonuclease HI [Clostridiales Family XIII bacterium]
MANSKNISVNIYTDGACAGNQSDRNFGGWGAILEYGKHVKELCGGEQDTTNNRMEMSALISALSALNQDGLRVNVFSDSSYLTNCLRDQWYVKWRRNGWLTSNKTPVENRDLWERLLSFLPKHDFRFYHVKGHVNLDGKRTDIPAAYGKFLAKNAGVLPDGDAFSYEDFLHITRMNNRADALANAGISEIRPAE